MTRDFDDQQQNPDASLNHDTDINPELDPHDLTEAPHAEDQAADAGGDEQHHGRDRGRDRGGRRQNREPRERLDSFEKMKVWQEAHQLTLRVFANTPNLPAEQQAGLALQMEQAAINVPKSIAEGFKRRGPRNKAHFYNVAQTAAESLRYYFILCRDLGFTIEYDDLAGRADQVSRMLDGLVRSMLR